MDNLQSEIKQELTKLNEQLEKENKSLREQINSYKVLNEINGKIIEGLRNKSNQT